MACSLALAFLVGMAGTTVARDDAFKVIVNRENAVTTIDKGFLRNAYLKNATQWPDGDAIRPIDLAKGDAMRDRFALDVLGKTAFQMRSYWLQRIFSGTSAPPPEAGSPAAALAYVLANRGAVAYVPVDLETTGAKVVTIH